MSLIELDANRNRLLWNKASRVAHHIIWCSLLTWSAFWLMPRPLHAQTTVDASLIADPAEVSVGDIFTLTLQIIHPADTQVSLTPLESQWGDFEIRQFEPLNTIEDEEGNEAISTQLLRATLWMTGSHTTPNYQITVANSDGNSSQYDVRPVTVTVNSVLQAGDDELRDIKPQATLPYTPRWVQMLVAAVLCAVVLGAIIWWLRRRWRTQPEEVVAPAFVDNRPADVKALEALREIAEQHLPTQRLFAEHYDLVTDVLRRYLDDGFDIPALDQTTAELKSSFPSNRVDGTDQALLFQLLEEADLVKFANVEPDFSQADQLPERARQFILSTANWLHRNDNPPNAAGNVAGARNENGSTIEPPVSERKA